MWTVSIVSLVIIIVIVALGLYHGAYKDNLMQCLGMCGLLVFYIAQIHAIWLDTTVGAIWTGVHVSTASYAIGTLVKVTISHGRALGWKWITSFDRKLQARKTGAGVFDSKPHHHWGPR